MWYNIITRKNNLAGGLRIILEIGAVVCDERRYGSRQPKKRRWDFACTGDCSGTYLSSDWFYTYDEFCIQVKDDKR